MAWYSEDCQTCASITGTTAHEKGGFFTPCRALDAFYENKCDPALTYLAGKCDPIDS